MGVGVGLYMYDVVIKKFTFTISSPDEFLLFMVCQMITNSPLLAGNPELQQQMVQMLPTMVERVWRPCFVVLINFGYCCMFSILPSVL